MGETPPTIVSFAVEKGQVWIGADGVSWYVAGVVGTDTFLERKVVETVPTKDLVRCYRQPNEAHPLHPEEQP